MDWNDTKAVERYFKAGEAITGHFARALTIQAGLDKVDHDEPLVVLDNACGTAIVSVHIYDVLPDEHAREHLQLTCGDISAPMLAIVEKRIRENGWKGAKTQKVDAQDTKLPSNHFTHVLTNFGFIGVKKPRAVLNEQHRILRPGGTIAMANWVTTGWFKYAEEAVRSFPSAPPFPTWPEFCNGFLSDEDTEPRDWHLDSFVEEQVRAHGFEDVKTVRVKSQTRHESAKEYCEVYGFLFNLVMTRFWNEKQKEEYGERVVTAVLKRLEEAFGQGEVVLDWEAAIVTGKKIKE